MSETPIHDKLKSDYEEVAKLSERIGGLRAQKAIVQLLQKTFPNATPSQMRVIDAVMSAKVDG